MSRLKRFIDIGANLTDSMYGGVYNSTHKHEPDLQHVLKRSWDAGLQKIIITGGNLSESKKALALATSDDRLYATVGCHPTRCDEFEASGDPAKYLNDLKEVIRSARRKIVAVGECGLDYDRLQFCAAETQKKFFELQLTLALDVELPLFLHCRNAAKDLYHILSGRTGLSGVVHSFDGSLEDARKFMDLGFFIGLNGCSLKTDQNLEVVKELPADKILLETDCPWCELRPSHAGFQFISKENQLQSVKKEKWSADCLVKSRNEPANIRHVLDVLAAIRNKDADVLAETIYENTHKLFFSK